MSYKSIPVIFPLINKPFLVHCDHGIQILHKADVNKALFVAPEKLCLHILTYRVDIRSLILQGRQLGSVQKPMYDTVAHLTSRNI